MPDILHRVGIKSSLDDVYKALTTREGLAGWWTNDTQGESTVGGVLQFRFGAGGFDMPVVVMAPELSEPEVAVAPAPEDEAVVVRRLMNERLREPKGPELAEAPTGSIVFEAEHFTQTNYGWEVHEDPACSGGAFAVSRALDESAPRGGHGRPRDSGTAAGIHGCRSRPDHPR